MYTTKDEGHGLVKLYWEDVRKQVAKLDKQLAKIIDDISPGKKFPVYKAYYPFGMTIADTKELFLPNMQGSSYKIDDADVPQDIIKHLGYAQYSIPTGMVLEKDIEYYVDRTKDGYTIPWFYYSPGSLFPLSRTLQSKQTGLHSYSGSNLLLLVAGARSTFMLPQVSIALNHSYLQRDYNFESPPPEELYEQWQIFKAISDSKVRGNNWHACLLYLSQIWRDKIHDDDAWLQLKFYLYEKAWNSVVYRRNQPFYDMAFSIIQKERNLKPNPYLLDTARHLFAIAMGAFPGYKPATDESALPLNLIQAAYIESYGLKKYVPTVIQPTLYNFENPEQAVYYSLQNPSLHVFSPKSRKDSNTSKEMRELVHIIKVIKEELCKPGIPCSDSILGVVARKVHMRAFHNKADAYHVIQPTKDIPNCDECFLKPTKGKSKSQQGFSADAKFLRGCVSLSRAE